MIGLEYLLLFGLPENKLEMMDGKTRVVLAFPTPDETQAHHQHWLLTLQRWQAAPAVACEREYDGQGLSVGGFELFRDRCVVQMRVPMSMLAYTNEELQYDRKTWGLGEGVEGFLDRWKFHGALSKQLGADVSGTELLLTPDSLVAPQAYWFKEQTNLPAGTPEGTPGLVGRDYLQGVPDLLVEVLLPAAEVELRGEKMSLYRQVGLRELWLLHPNRRSIEVYQKFLDRFARVGEFGPGETFRCHDRLVDPAALLPERGRHKLEIFWDERDEPAGLEHFLLGGAPFRRFDFYQGLARRWFACTSQERSVSLETQARMEMARWDPEGRLFDLQRVNDRVLRLNVRIEASIHRRLFRYWHFEGKWR